MRGLSESLAGRIGTVDLAGFDLAETGPDSLVPLWSRGGFPRSFLAANHRASFAWRLDFVRTFLERDLPQLGITVPVATLRRFWTMIAHYHGQTWSAAEFYRSLGADETARRQDIEVAPRGPAKNAKPSQTILRSSPRAISPNLSPV